MRRPIRVHRGAFPLRGHLPVDDGSAIRSTTAGLLSLGVQRGTLQGWVPALTVNTALVAFMAMVKTAIERRK